MEQCRSGWFLTCVAALEWQYARVTPGPAPSQNELHDSEAFHRKESPFWPCGGVIFEFQTRTLRSETRGCGVCSHANDTRPPQAALGIRKLDDRGQEHRRSLTRR